MAIDKELISTKTVKGIFALISRSFLLNVVSLVAFLIISSILLPVQIGVYTAVIAIQRIISFFTDFGFGAALIQKENEIKEKDLVTSFTLQALITLSIFVVVFIFQNQISSFFNLDKSAKGLLLALVFTIFISSFKTIPSVLLERKIDFHKLIFPQIIESLVFNFILVILVLRGYGIQAFTWAFIISSVVGLPVYYLLSPWKIRVGIYRESLSHLKYGIQFQSKSIIATIKDDFLTVILTKLISYQDLGYVGFAQRLSFFVYRYIVDSLTKVTFSTYSRAQGDKDFLVKAVDKSLFFVSAIMFPSLLGLMITAPYFIDFFPGWNNKWEPAILSIVFFSLNAVVSSVSGILINLLDATGKVKVTLKFMLLWTVMTWILTPLLIMIYGYNGVAIASFLVSTTVFITIYEAKKILSFRIIKNIYKPLIFSLIMSIWVYFAQVLFARDLISLMVVILSGVAVYLSLLYISSKDDFNAVLKVLLRVS